MGASTSVGAASKSAKARASRHSRLVPGYRRRSTLAMTFPCAVESTTEVLDCSRALSSITLTLRPVKACQVASKVQASPSQARRPSHSKLACQPLVGACQASLMGTLRAAPSSSKKKYQRKVSPESSTSKLTWTLSGSKVPQRWVAKTGRSRLASCVASGQAGALITDRQRRVMLNTWAKRPS